MPSTAAFCGGGISFIDAPGEQSTVQAVDPAMPVHGPFSADFKFVTLPDRPGEPIRCSDGQAAVFRSLWSFKGEPMTAEVLHLRLNTPLRFDRLRCVS